MRAKDTGTSEGQIDAAGERRVHDVSTGGRSASSNGHTRAARQRADDGAKRPGRVGRRVVLGPGWPLVAIFVGYPLWWLLGLRSFVFLFAVVPMALTLARRSRLVAPRGFGVWLLFVAWAAAGLALVGAHAPGATDGQMATRLFPATYRVGWYIALTVVLLYVGNLSERELSSRRICRLLSVLFMLTVAGGYLGIVAPRFQFTSPVEHLVPTGIANNAFFKSLTHPVSAQVQSFLGYDEARPAAPFGHANDWGANFGLLLPFFVLEWLRRDGGWRRWVGVGVLAAAAVPAVASLNRGLWLGLSVMAVYAAASAAVSGRFAALAGLVSAGAAVVVVAAVTPLGGTIQERLATPHSNNARSTLASRTVAAVTHGSPVAGFGSTRDVQGNFTTIGGGATPECPRCAPPAMGTQGHIWLVIFSQGFVGAALFFWFVLRRFLPHLCDRRPLASAVCASLVFFFVVISVYDLLDAPMFTVTIGLALLWRMQRAPAPLRVEPRAVAAGAQ
ncbi:MAG: hypothetical protein M3304_07735 [Actinomycetota bacterium]|nr:hypothetical protein [Actinomycetota bacterium]